MVQTRLVTHKRNWEIISPEKNLPASRRSPKRCEAVHRMERHAGGNLLLCNAYLPKLNSGARTLFHYPLASVALIDPWLWDPSPWNQERHAVPREPGVLISNYIPFLVVRHQIQAIRLRDISLTIYSMCRPLFCLVLSLCFGILPLIFNLPRPLSPRRGATLRVEVL